MLDCQFDGPCSITKILNGINESGKDKKLIVPTFHGHIDFKQSDWLEKYTSINSTGNFQKKTMSKFTNYSRKYHRILHRRVNVYPPSRIYIPNLHRILD